jgi:N-methylhydantoinase B
MSQKPDPITTEVIRSAYNAIAEDMSAVLARGAFSPVIYEMHDYGIALFNERVELLGQYPGLPLFTGGLDAGVKAVVEKYGLENLRKGDVFTVNDSYITGGHLNDVDVIGIIATDDGAVIGFACIRAHWADIGGASLGYTIRSASIFQEGLRWGPVRIVSQGEWVTDILDIFALNSRLPKSIMGDLGAQRASITIGERRFLELAARFGLPTIRECTEEIFAATERKFRDFVRRIPDGTYTAEGCTDDDGITADPVWVRVNVVVKGDEILVDSTGSSPQCAGNVNCGLPYAVSAVRLAFALLFADAEPEINHGSFKMLEVIAEPGSIFNAQEPAACMKPVPVMLLLDLVIKALAPVQPDLVAAGLPGDSWNVFFAGRHPKTGQLFFTGESLDGGWGANAREDGESAVIHSAAGDFRNMPVETFESRFPILVTSLTLAPDSGGAGARRGGLAVLKEYQARAPVDVSIFFDRSKTLSWGLFGGGDGGVPATEIIQAGRNEPMRGLKFAEIPLQPGDRVIALSGGGGGYGPAFARDPLMVRDDVQKSYVSCAAARSVYGVALGPAPEFALDAEQTRSLRSAASGRAA